VAFAHQDDAHSQALRFVGEHVAHDAAGHLVQPLVAGVSVVGAMTDIA
jgi:hypothetical protein